MTFVEFKYILKRNSYTSFNKLIWNSEKKKYSNSRVVRKKNSETKQKIITPLPPFNLNGWSLSIYKNFSCVFNVIFMNKHVGITLSVFLLVLYSGARGTDHPPFSNFLFTNLFSIKFLYFFIKD
jgi:hypothetical protein